MPDHDGMILFFLVFLNRDLIGRRTFHSIQVDHVSEHVPDHIGMIVSFCVFLHPDLIAHRTFHYAYVASIVPYVHEVSAVPWELDQKEGEGVEGEGKERLKTNESLIPSLDSL